MTITMKRNWLVSSDGVHRNVPNENNVVSISKKGSHWDGWRGMSHLRKYELEAKERKSWQKESVLSSWVRWVESSLVECEPDESQSITSDWLRPVTPDTTSFTLPFATIIRFEGKPEQYLIEIDLSPWPLSQTNAHSFTFGEQIIRIGQQRPNSIWFKGRFDI